MRRFHPATAHAACPCRICVSRYLSPGRPLAPYDATLALGYHLLGTLQDGAFRGEHFVDCVQVGWIASPG